MADSVGETDKGALRLDCVVWAKLAAFAEGHA